MLICQRQPDLGSAQGDDEQVDKCAAANAYPRLEESPSFIASNKEMFEVTTLHTNSADPEKLQGKQLQVYQVVDEHLQQVDAEPLKLVVSGTAGTGKSYLIHCLKQLLKQKLWVAAPTGVVAFNIEGCTLHSLLDIPARGELKALEGNRLKQLQERFSGVRHLIVDERSMVGRKMFGQIDKRLSRLSHTRLVRYLVAAVSCFSGTLVNCPL